MIRYTKYNYKNYNIEGQDSLLDFLEFDLEDDLENGKINNIYISNPVFPLIPLSNKAINKLSRNIIKKIDNKSKYPNNDWQLSLFDIDFLLYDYQSNDDILEELRHDDVYVYKTKTIKAGNLLELEIYPIIKKQAEKRAKKEMPSREAQENLNHKNTKKKIMRLANANFTDNDLWGTFGYDNDNLPDSPEAARKDVINFMRRLKRKQINMGYPPLKYIYVTEYSKSESGSVRCHHHIIMSGDMNRDTIEGLWKGGAYPQTRRLRIKEDTGLNGLAAYIAKGSKYQKLWAHSTNMKQPIITTAYNKITPKQVETIATHQTDVNTFFEKKCNGYIFKDMEIKRSEFIAGAYIYVQMYKRRL